MIDVAESLPTAVLADELLFVGEALGRLLRTTLRVLNVVHTGEEFNDAVRACHPDVAIIDLALGGAKLGNLQQLRKEKFSTRFIVTCDNELIAAAGLAMTCGADAFVPKQRASSELLRAVDAVLSGRCYVAPLAPQNDRDSDFARIERLTKRQREVAHYVLLGYSARQIAIELNLSKRTVEAHRGAIVAIFNLSSVFELRARIRPFTDLL